MALCWFYARTPDHRGCLSPIMAPSKTFDIATRLVLDVAGIPSWPTVQELLQKKLDQGDRDDVFHLSLRYILAVTPQGQEDANVALARLAWEGWDWTCNRMLWFYQGYESEHEFVRSLPVVYMTVMERLTNHAMDTALWDTSENQRHKSTQIAIDSIQQVLGPDGLYLCRPAVIGNPYSMLAAQRLWQGCWEKLGGRQIQLGKGERANWAAAFQRAQTIKRTIGSFPTPRYLGTSRNRHKRRLAPPPPLPAPRVVADSLDGLTLEEMKQYHRQYCFAVNSLIDVVYEEVVEVEDEISDRAGKSTAVRRIPI